MVKMNPQDYLLKKSMAINIKTNYQAGMKPRDISFLLKVSKQVVNYWIHNPIIEKRKRRTKLIRKEKSLLIKWAKERPINLVSARKIQRKFNSLLKRKKKKIEKKVSLSTVNRTLYWFLSKPKHIKKVFFLSSTNREQRKKFLQFMKNKGNKPANIYFTDESTFNLSSYFNRNYKIRLSPKTQKNK